MVAVVSLLAGCDPDTAGSQENSTGNIVRSSVSEDAAQTGEQSGDASGNVLVVYFSATGNTEEVANVIAETMGGELFELEPAEPYSDADLNWSDDSSRVSRKYANKSLRTVEFAVDTVENWDSYFLRIWPEPATGRRGGDSVPGLMGRMCRHGWKAWDCKKCKLLS